MADPQDGPPSGWIARDGLVVPLETVRGFAARLQIVKGICRARGCKRQVQLDPEVICKGGQGGLAMPQVYALWRCNRIEGCGLEFHTERSLNPLILGQLVGKPHVRIRVRCRGDRCKFHRVWRVEEMIAGLERRSQGGSRTEVEGLGAKMTTACPICKRVNWTVDILWADTGSMGWKVLGERSFEPQEPG